MATATAKLRSESDKNLDHLQRTEAEYRSKIAKFLNHQFRKLLIIEIRDLLLTVRSLQQLLKKLVGNLRRNYGEDDNQMVVTWSQLRRVTEAEEVLPNFPNLLFLELDKAESDEGDVKLLKKLLERLSLSNRKKVVVLAKDTSRFIYAMQLINGEAYCTLEDDEEDDEIEVEESYLSVCNLLFQTKSFLKGKDRDDKDFNQTTALHMACLDGHKDGVLKLLQSGARHVPNEYTKNTPLHHAALLGYNDIVTIFLERGVDVDIKGRQMQTPLHYAADTGKHDVLKTLIEYGANIEAKDESGCTPLHYAARKGRKSIVKALLEYEAESEAKCDADNTPLHLAVENNHLDVVKVLVNWKNAKLDCRNSDGDTPLDVAKNREFKAIARYLTLKGCA